MDSGLSSPKPPTAGALQEEAAIPDILTTQKGSIFEITLNRPQDGNAASDDMAEQLTKLLRGAAGSADIIVLRGAGDDFCVGRSTAGRRPASNSPDALERRFGSDVVFDCYNAFRLSPAPIIGVVKGRALGFGCAIAAVCDITLAADSAQFQIPEMLHNIMPTMVMSALVDRVPRKTMSYFVYSTAMIGAARAREAGLVSEVFPLAELDAAVETLCATMMKAPLPARLGVKEYTRCALDMDVHSAIDYARNLHATINSAAAMRPKPK
ncbi:MAG TPA: enoyl-CoA hydratase/isomerase family protein [Xanthobacteraceae bacterium]